LAECKSQWVTATHNIDIAPEATKCVSVIDGLKTLKIGAVIVDFGDTRLNATTVNLTGIDAIEGLLDIVVDTYGCELEPSCRVPYGSITRFVTSDTLRKITGPISPRRKSDMSGPMNPVELRFPLLDSGSETGFQSIRNFFGPGGIFSAEFGTCKVLLEPGVETLQFVETGANATSFYLTDKQLPHSPDNLNLVSNCGGHATIEITNNTGLGMVLLPNLYGAVLLLVSSNADLHTMELGIANATLIRVEKNAQNLNLTLPHLRSIGVDYFASYGTFSDLFSISLPRLEKTTGMPCDLIFANNTILALQLPRLGSVNGSLIINTNKALFDIGLPRLQTVSSDLILHDSPRLLNFTANVLKTASSISLIGSFTNVELFSLERVSGNFEVIGDPSMDCSWFDAHLRDKIVKGSYTCVGNHTYTPRPTRHGDQAPRPNCLRTLWRPQEDPGPKTEVVSPRPPKPVSGPALQSGLWRSSGLVCGASSDGDGRRGTPRARPTSLSWTERVSHWQRRTGQRSARRMGLWASSRLWERRTGKAGMGCLWPGT
jgi:hypothetical protein